MDANVQSSVTSQLPLILREEPFGGIVFDPFDATMLELDHEAFTVARKMVEGKHFLFQPKQRRMLRELNQELHYDSTRRVRVIAPTASVRSTVTGISVLNAPTLVDFQITTRCEMGCPHCYAEARTDGQDVCWNDIMRVLDQVEQCGVCQLAIGGGEPLLHPRIIDLLAYCHEKGIVPNLTTSGSVLDEERLRALTRYCGAVGISMEGVGEHYSRVRGRPFADFVVALNQMREYQIPIVIQTVLSADNFHQLDEIVSFCLEQQDLYGVIFLAYKPVGRGKNYSQPLATLDTKVVTEGLARTFNRLSGVMRVGFDCCMTPAVAGVEQALAFVDHTSLEGCSGMRGSVGVSPELDVLPCTFLVDYKMGNLKHQTLLEIWRSQTSERFRQSIIDHVNRETVCQSCLKREHCMAGCPVMGLVNCMYPLAQPIDKFKDTTA